MRFAKMMMFVLMTFICVGNITSTFGQGILGMPVTLTFPVSELTSDERHPATAYNILRDEFFVVYQDARAGTDDLYGRIFSSDGSPVTDEFVVCNGAPNQMYPATDYNRLLDEYIVVYQNEFQYANDIYGIRINWDGSKLWSPRSLPDTTFIVCDAEMCQTHPKVAHNYTNNTHLVVWDDNRNYPTTNTDIYGQRLNWNADLMLPVQQPAESPATDVNYPLSLGLGEDVSYKETSPDVAYHGSYGTELNEWLVVFQRQVSVDEIWGVRVRGTDGMLLDTYGEVPDHLPIAYKSGTLGGPPWFPEFPIGRSTGARQACPHVESNAKWSPFETLNGNRDGVEYSYPIPEFLVVWTDFRNDIPDIYGQRVAYFPDSTAVEMGLKPNEVADSLFTAALLDTAGDWNGHLLPWIKNDNYPVTDHLAYQSWNDLTYNQNNGEYLVVWNDWRGSGWDGIAWPAPEADIYAQRLFLNPNDSALVWLDDDGVPMTDRSINIAITDTRTPDEGNAYYPAPDHGTQNNEYLIAYEYDMPADDNNIDIHGSFYAGTPSAGILIGIEVTPDEVTIELNATQQFEATGYDAQGNEIEITPDWSASGGNISGDGLYTATDVGDFDVIATVNGFSDMAIVHVTAPQLARIEVTPEEVTLDLDDTQQFEAKGYDSQGNEMEITPAWTASGGNISEEGLYTATDVGDFDVIATADGFSDTAVVHVMAPQLSWIDVIPAEVDMNPGQQQQFEAHGFDVDSNEIYIQAIWMVDGGDITENGLYTAPDLAGDYTVTASVEGSLVIGTAEVHVWPTGVETIGRIPNEFNLSQNFPNPFNAETTIIFDVKEQSHVELKVYNLQGHEVYTLVDDKYAPGSYRVKLHSTAISSGIYFYKIHMGNFQSVKKLVVLE